MGTGKAGLDGERKTIPRHSRKGYEDRVQDAMAGKFDQAQVPDAPAATATQDPSSSTQPPLPPETPPPPDDDAFEQTPPGVMPRNVKIPVNDDPVTLEAARIMKMRRDAGKPISLVDAARLAEQNLGLAQAPPPPNGDTPPDTTTPTAEPQTVEAVDERIKALRAEKKDAAENFDFERQTELEEQIDRLLDQRSELKITASQQRQQQQTTEQQQAEHAQAQFRDQWSASCAEAAKVWPDAAKGDSPITVEARKILADMQAANSPLLADPESAFAIYAKAARKLGLAPSSPSQPAPAPAAPPILASGTTGNPATQPAGSQLPRARSRHEYHRNVAMVTGSR